MKEKFELLDYIYKKALEGNASEFKQAFNLCKFTANERYDNGDRVRTFLMIVLENDTSNDASIIQGHIDIARFLLEKGADIYIKSYDSILGDEFDSPWDICVNQMKHDERMEQRPATLMASIFSFFPWTRSYSFGKNIIPLICEANKQHSPQGKITSDFKLN